MIADYKKVLKKLVADNKIDDVIAALTDFSKDNEKIKDEIILISSRLGSLEERVRKGMLNHSEEYNIRNQITDNLLALINKISKVDYVLHVESSEIVITLKEELKHSHIQKLQYTKEIQALKKELFKLHEKVSLLEKEVNEGENTIKELKKLQEAKLIKFCENCQGKGSHKETLNVTLTLKINPPKNPFRIKEQVEKQVKEQIEQQIAEKIAEHSLTPIEAVSLELAMNSVAIVLGIQFMPFMSTRTVERKFNKTIEREVICSKCGGAGMQNFTKNE